MLMHAETCRWSRKSVHYCLILTKTELYWQILVMLPSIKFYENLVSGFQVGPHLNMAKPTCVFTTFPHKCAKRNKYCKIWGSHSGGYEEFYLPGYVTESAESWPTFWRNISPPSSGSKVSQARNQHEAGSKWSFLALQPWRWSWNVGYLSMNYMALYSRR
jgi:hypothetical protein